MNDDQADVKQEGGEEAAIPESSTEETQATGEVETPIEEAPSTEEAESRESPTETEDAPKKGAQARIRELNAKAKSAEEKAKGLEAKLAELTGSVEPTAPQVPYTPQITPGAEIDEQTYKSDVMQTANSIVELKLKQNEAVSRINSEAREAVSAYPQLDPDSDQYDPELSEAVTEATLNYVKGQPYTASPKKFVDKLMKPYARAVTKEVGKETANIAKQVAESAMRPTSVSTNGKKSDAEKSIKELEAELGIEQY